MREANLTARRREVHRASSEGLDMPTAPDELESDWVCVAS